MNERVGWRHEDYQLGNHTIIMDTPGVDLVEALVLAIVDSGCYYRINQDSTVLYFGTENRSFYLDIKE